MNSCLACNESGYWNHLYTFFVVVVSLLTYYMCLLGSFTNEECAEVWWEEGIEGSVRDSVALIPLASCKSVLLVSILLLSQTVMCACVSV